MSETSSKQLMYCMAHRTVGSLVLLPRGAYPGTGKHYWVVSVRENFVSILTQGTKNGKDFLLAVRLSSPALKGGALCRDLVKIQRA